MIKFIKGYKHVFLCAGGPVWQDPHLLPRVQAHPGPGAQVCFTLFIENVWSYIK